MLNSGSLLPLPFASLLPPPLQRFAGPLATEYLRSRTLFLSNRRWPAVFYSQAETPQKRTALPSRQVTAGPLAAEIAALPADCELVRTEEFSAFVAQSHQIPHLLQEIGRAREEAFQAIGAGTGNEADLDWFDQHYRHLFLWSRRDNRRAGAYRMALTQEVIQATGIRGLYTSTLFHYTPEFFERVGPALELGRSFVAPDFQKSYSPLLLLWKGIARFVQHHPEAAILFGAVTISRDYQAASRGLIASYLADRLFGELAPMVRPRKRWREPAAEAATVKRLASVAATIEEISLSISDIEEDRKGVPVLIRQYLKAGGRLIGFNVDSHFSNSLDALILVDLRAAPISMLERCMGRVGTNAFLDFHAYRGAAPIWNFGSLIMRTNQEPKAAALKNEDHPPCPCALCAQARQFQLESPEAPPAPKKAKPVRLVPRVRTASA